MVTPEAVVMAPPARLMGLLPKNRAGLSQFSRNLSNVDTMTPRSEIESSARREGAGLFNEPVVITLTSVYFRVLK